MAITRTQQARQMYKKGSKKPVEQAGVMNYMPSEMVTVPKIAKSSPTTPTAKLAYITPEEQDILIDLNLYGSLDGKPNRGPGGIPSLEGDFGSPTGQVDTSPGSFGGPGGSYGEAGSDVSGRRDTGTGDYRDSTRPDDVAARKEYEVNRKKREADKKQKEIEKKFKADAKATRKEMRKKLAEDKKRRQQRIQDVLARKTKNPFGLTDTELADLKAAGLYDEEGFTDPELTSSSLYGGLPESVASLFEKSDKFSGAEMEAFKEKFDTPDLPGLLGMGLKLFEGPLKKGSRKTKDFFTDDVLGAGKFTYKGQRVTPEMFKFLSPTEMQEVYGDYMDRRMGGDIDAYGNPIMRQDDGGPDPILPILPTTPTTPTPEDPRQILSTRILGSQFDPTFFAADGGIANLARQELFLGGIVKGVKKGLKGITRGIKKVAKSPLGKIALAAAAGGYGFGLGPFKGLAGSGFLKGAGMKNFFLKDAAKGFGLGNLSGKGIASIIGGASLLPLLMGQKEDKFDIEEYYRQNALNPNAPLNRRIAGSEFSFADGGSTEKEPVAKKTMPLLDMGGQEMDLRAEGGFVPIGRMEKADDVPARLSKNEFVFTAEAVRNAGDGDVDKGAEVMYNMMKNLEDGGDVSEESQGLEGARKMFQTSQRLGEVL